MIIIDWVIVGVVGYNAVLGIYRGFIRILFDLVALGLSIFAAFKLHTPVAEFFQSFLPFAPLAMDIISIVSIWGLVYIVVIGVGMGLQKATSLMAMGPLNAFAGLLLGIIRGALIAAPIVMVWQLIDPGISQQSVLLNSFLFK